MLADYLARMRILVCENNAIIVMDLVDLLEDLGHMPSGTADTSDRCLELARTIRPYLVFVDLNLDNGRTGLALVEALAALGIPSVIVSAEAHTVPKTSSALACIDKPFSAAVIEATLKHLSPPTAAASTQ